MTRLDRLVLAEIVAPFFGGVMLFTGLFMSADNLLKILDYATKGVSPLLLFQFFLFALPPAIAFTSPMSMLLATLLGFGRLSGDSETIALSAAGAPLERILAPVVAFGLIVSLFGVYLNDTVVPSSERGRQAIINEQKRIGGTSFGKDAFDYRQTNDKGQLTAHIHTEGPLSAVGGGRFRMEDVTVVRYEEGKPSEVLYAPIAEGTEGSMEWQLSGGIKAFGVDKQGNQSQLSGDSISTTRSENLATPEALNTAARPNIELTTADLKNKARVLRDNKSESGAREVEVEIARRYAIPFGSLIFAMVGAPLGISPRRSGKGIGFGYSVLITFLYWITLQFASSLGRSGALPPIVAVSIPNLIGLGVAVYLILQARR